MRRLKIDREDREPGEWKRGRDGVDGAGQIEISVEISGSVNSEAAVLFLLGKRRRTTSTVSFSGCANTDPLPINTADSWWLAT